MYVEIHEEVPGRPVVCIASEALQYLRENQITNDHDTRRQQLIELACGGVLLAIEVVDPHTGIDQCHYDFLI
jgi:hypothetical protein